MKFPYKKVCPDCGTMYMYGLLMPTEENPAEDESLVKYPANKGEHDKSEWWVQTDPPYLLEITELEDYEECPGCVAIMDELKK